MVMTFDPPETAPLDYEEVLDYLTEIEPSFECPDKISLSFDLYLQSLKQLLKKMLPKETLEFARSITSLDDLDLIDAFYHKLLDSLPAGNWADSSNASPPYIISASTLCISDYAHGVGRFLSDIYSRWLIPGKQLHLVHMQSMAFRFKAFPVCGFFLNELFIKVDTRKDLTLALSHLPNLVREIMINISSVQHTRKIISLKPLSLDQKRMIIQENISTLLNRSSKELDHNIFDQVHNFLIKATAEEKVTQINEQIAPLLEFRPQIFDREIFYELQNLVFLFKDTFTAPRELRHLARLIAYTYLFRKSLANSILASPLQRHLIVKILHARLEERRILGVLIAINVLAENEILGEKHLFKAIQSILPTAQKVTDSTISDRRNNTNVKTLYLEIYKKDGKFSLEEIRMLQKRLPREIKTRIESVINPIFMPKNEEEIMRNILILSNQLKYIQDIPQVIISFHKQTDTKLSFTIVLLRVLKPEDQPLQKLFLNYAAKIKFSDLEVKNVGLIRRRYPKEANIFEMHLEKKNFLRKDFSVDLNQARKHVFNILTEMVGEVRDYNGGMISKQTEVLSELKKLLLQINIRNDFLLENFFYSLVPNYMQSISKPTILKKLFLLVLEAIEHDYSNQIYFLKTQIVENFFLLTLGAINPTFKEFIEERLEALDLEQPTLTSSYVTIYDISCLSYMLKFNDSDQHQLFLQSIIESIKIWKDTVQKNTPSNFFPTI